MTKKEMAVAAANNDTLVPCVDKGHDTRFSQIDEKMMWTDHGITIVCSHANDEWTYYITKDGSAITRKIKSKKSPQEDDPRVRDAQIKKGMSLSKTENNSDLVLDMLNDFGLFLMVNEEIIDEFIEIDPIVNTDVGINADTGFDMAEVKNEARRIMKTGNPIEYILDAFNKIHIGDRRIGEILVLSVGSSCIANCAGIHPKLSGDSGKGKSHSCKTMIHLIPPEYVCNTSLSAKAMFFSSMEDGVVMFSDDIELSDELESIIKRSTSEFQQGIEHQTVDINRKGKSLVMPKRIVWWLASVDNDFDMQTLNRQVGVSVDNSPDTDKLVKEQQLRMAGTGEPEYPETFDVQVCREIYLTIKQLFVRVVIPFYDRIEWMGEQNRRNLPVFLDMLKVYALFKHLQRDHRYAADGVCEIIATEEDFDNASKLYISRAEMQTSKLTDNEMKIVDFLASYGTADINRIAAATKLTHNTVQRLLTGRKDRCSGGLLDKVKGLQVSVINREQDGGHVNCKEFSLIGYNRLASYGNIIRLKA